MLQKLAASNRDSKGSSSVCCAAILGPEDKGFAQPRRLQVRLCREIQLSRTYGPTVGHEAGVAEPWVCKATHRREAL